MMALLFFEAVLFGLFTLAMFTEQARFLHHSVLLNHAGICLQVSSILADQTGIERLKNDYVPQQRSVLFSMSETFGRPFSFLWLLPTSVDFHGLTYRDMLEYEMGEETNA